MFQKLSQNVRKCFVGFTLPYIDSKIFLFFSYRSDKSLGSSDARRDLFFVLIIVLPFYLPLHYQAGCSDFGFITYEPYNSPIIHSVLVVLGYF